MENSPTVDGMHVGDHESDDRLFAALVARLRRSPPGQHAQPLRALVIARALGIRPQSGRESRRRGVRILISRLRSRGIPVATDGDGYWLAASPADHLVYQEYRRRCGLTNLVAASSDARSSAASDAVGQLGLFAAVARPASECPDGCPSPPAHGAKPSEG